MVTRHVWLCGLAAAFICAERSQAAFESVIANVPSVALTGTTAAADPSLAGTVIADTIGNFSGIDFQGTYQTRVVQRTDNGLLDFYYRINSFQDQSTQGRLLRDFRISDYVGFTTSATWRPDGLPAPAMGEAWQTSIRFPQPQAPTADGINVSFLDLSGGQGSLTSGKESYFAVIRTDATAFKTVVADVYLVGPQGGQFLSGFFNVYAPAVPEATTSAGLLALAFVGMAVLGKSRGSR